MYVPIEPPAGGVAKEPVFAHTHRVGHNNMEDMSACFNIKAQGEWVVDFVGELIILGFKKVEVFCIDGEPFGNF